jgi:Domain of unknown function (DUF4160)
MPELSRFLGIIIAMYHNDHEPPHMHVVYAEHQAKIDIANGAVIDGNLPRRVLTLVGKWRKLHAEELAEAWRLAQAREPLPKIEPLD